MICIVQTNSEKLHCIFNYCFQRGGKNTEGKHPNSVSAMAEESLWQTNERQLNNIPHNEDGDLMRGVNHLFTYL